MKNAKIAASSLLLAAVVYAQACTRQCLICPDFVEGVEYTYVGPDGTTVTRVTDVNGCITFNIPDDQKCSDYTVDDKGPGPILE